MRDTRTACVSPTTACRDVLLLLLLLAVLVVAVPSHASALSASSPPRQRIPASATASCSGPRAAARPGLSLLGLAREAGPDLGRSGLWWRGPAAAEETVNSAAAASTRRWRRATEARASRSASAVGGRVPSSLSVVDAVGALFARFPSICVAGFPSRAA
eukprot:5194457-Pyramimonas_sp.AAC.1